MYTSNPRCAHWLGLFAVLCAFSASADEPATLAARLDGKVREIQAWAAETLVVNAVRSQNQNPPAAYADMTQAIWKTLSVLDPKVRHFTRNEAGAFLKSRKDQTVSEAFLSSADGKKVAFLSKPTNWSHAGKDKHDQPMKGEVWRSAVEVDESTGVQQIQIAVPVLDGGKAIGSLVVGIDITRLSSKE